MGNQEKADDKERQSLFDAAQRAHRLRNAAKAEAVGEHVHWEQGARPWGWNRLDAREYFEDSMGMDYSESFPGIEEELTQYLKGINQALVWDICGIADASSLGARHTLCLTLTTPLDPDQLSTLNTDTREVFTADITRPNALTPLLLRSSEMDKRPNCIFFNPVGGLLSLVDSDPELAVRIFGRHLSTAYQTLEQGGYLFIQSPFQEPLKDPIKKPKYSAQQAFDFIKGVCGEAAEYRADVTRGFFLVRKR